MTFKQQMTYTDIAYRTFTYILFFLISAYLPPLAVHAAHAAGSANAAEQTVQVVKTEPLESAITPKPENETQYGVSMHDSPALKSANEHLPYTNPDAPKGGALKQAVIGTFDNLNPYNIKGVASARGLNLIYDRLTTRSWDEPFTLYPLIAQHVSFSDDRLTIDIKLNPKARFTNGDPITSADVFFTYETLKTSGRPNMRNVYKLVEDYKIIDEHTLKISLKPESNREAAMIMAMMPVLSKSYWQDRDFNESLTEVPISNGAYKVKSFEIGRDIIYERDTTYWAKDLPIIQGLYNFDEVRYDYYRDDDVALMAFNAGDVNYRRESNVSKWMTGYEKINAKKQPIKRQEIRHGRPDKAHSIIFNMRRHPFDQVGVRKALSSLIDFQWVNKNIYHDKKNREITYFPNSHFTATGAPSSEETAILGRHKYDIPLNVLRDTLRTPDTSNTQQVRKIYMHADYMLRQAGWVIEDGLRVQQDSKTPLSFELIVSNPEDEKLALAFKRSLKRLGIQPAIRRLDSAAFQGRLKDYDFDSAISFWNTSLSPGTEQRLYWSCDAADTKAQWNYSGVCNSAIDYLLTKLTNTTSRDDLILHMRMLDRILTNLYIGVPLFHRNKDYVAYTDDLEKPEKDALYGVIIESWWEKQQN